MVASVEGEGHVRSLSGENGVVKTSKLTHPWMRIGWMVREKKELAGEGWAVRKTMIAGRTGVVVSVWGVSDIGECEDWKLEGTDVRGKSSI